MIPFHTIIIFGTAELQLTPLFVVVNTVKLQLTDTLENIRSKGMALLDFAAQLRISTKMTNN
jgi:hypothetical protein